MAAVDERWGEIAHREDRPFAEVAKGYTSFRHGDVLFAKITPSMENGKVAIARDLTNGFGFGSTEFFVLRPGTSMLGEYLFLFLRQPGFREQAKRHFTGTAGQQRVPKSYLENAPIPLPPLDEQRRIIAALDHSAKIGRLRARAAKCMQEFTSALFVKMFGRPREIAKRFPCKPLQEVAEIASGATKGRRVAPADRADVPYLRVANVQDGFLDLDEMKTIAIRRSEIDKYALAAGDLVMTEGGDIDKLGRAAVWNGELAYCAHQNHVFRVRPNRALVLADYLRGVAGSEHGKSYFLSVAKRTTGIASINKTQLGGLSVPLPPLELQMQYSRLTAKARAIALQADVAAAKATALSNSMMASLLSAEGHAGRVGRAECTPSGMA